MRVRFPQGPPKLSEQREVSPGPLIKILCWDNMYKIFSLIIAFVISIFSPNSVVDIATVPPPDVIEALPSSISPILENFIKNSASQIADPQKGQAPQVVEKDESVTGLSKNDCNNMRGESNTFDCWQIYYQAIVKNEGIPAAFYDLKKNYNINSYVKSQCHPLTHIIGQAAVEKYPDVAEAYLHGDAFCWSGYYHGVLEGVAGKLGNEKMFATLNTICSGVVGKEQYSFDYYNCVHGLGHGVMALTQDELFDSLLLCDKLDGSWEQQSCAGGVFMENVIIDNKNHFTKYLKPEEPLYPCTQAPEQYKGTCFLMQTSYMLKVTGNDFKKVFDLCANAPSDYRPQCYQSLGRDASGQSTSNIIVVKNTCEFGKDFDQKANCIIGATKDFVSYFHSDKQALQLCDSLTTDLQTVCSQTVTAYYKSFN